MFRMYESATHFFSQNREPDKLSYILKKLEENFEKIGDLDIRLKAKENSL